MLCLSRARASALVKIQPTKALGTTAHHPEAETPAPALGIEPAPKGRAQVTGVAVPRPATDHPGRVLVTGVIRIDTFRHRVVIGVAPGIPAPLPDTARHILAAEWALPGRTAAHRRGRAAFTG